MKENNATWSLTRMLTRLHRSNRGVGFLFHPVVLAVILDVAIVLALGFGLGWSHVFSGVLGIRPSVLVAVIALPLAILGPGAYVKATAVLLFVIVIVFNVLTVF